MMVSAHETLWVLESEEGAAVVVGRGTEAPKITPGPTSKMRRYVPMLSVIRHFGGLVVTWWASAEQYRKLAYGGTVKPNHVAVYAGRSDGLCEAADQTGTTIDALASSKEEQAWVKRMAEMENEFGGFPGSTGEAAYAKRRQLMVLLRLSADLFKARSICVPECLCAECTLRKDIESVLENPR